VVLCLFKRFICFVMRGNHAKENYQYVPDIANIRKEVLRLLEVPEDRDESDEFIIKNVEQKIDDLLDELNYQNKENKLDSIINSVMRFKDMYPLRREELQIGNAIKQLMLLENLNKYQNFVTFWLADFLNFKLDLTDLLQTEIPFQNAKSYVMMGSEFVNYVAPECKPIALFELTSPNAKLKLIKKYVDSTYNHKDLGVSQFSRLLSENRGFRKIVFGKKLLLSQVVKKIVEDLKKDDEVINEETFKSNLFKILPLVK